MNEEERNVILQIIDNLKDPEKQQFNQLVFVIGISIDLLNVLIKHNEASIE